MRIARRRGSITHGGHRPREADVSEPVCAVCRQPAGAVYREMRAGQVVCMKCNPFRRCPKCLGVFQTASTPNDMGRVKCDGCGAISRR